MQQNDVFDSKGLQNTEVYDILNIVKGMVINMIVIKDGKQFGVKLRKARADKGLKIHEMAKEFGVNKSSISRWESGDTTRFKDETISKICVHYGLDINYLLGSEDTGMVKVEDFIKYVPEKKIPLIGVIAAGQPLYAEENIEGYISYDGNDGAEYFALRVKGDSMNAARIEEGDILIIRRQSYVENGEIAAVMVNGDNATVKKFHQNNSTVVLMPMSRNPVHQPQVYDLNETKVEVLGKVVENKINFN